MSIRLQGPRRLFLLLMILSLVVRIASSLAIGLRPDPSFLDIGDEREYYEQSSAILHGNYTVDLRRPIGYVSLLALLKLITLDNFSALQLVNAAVFSLTAPLSYLLVRRITGNDVAAALTGLAVIVWPPFIYYGRTLYSETATLPLFTLFLAVLPRGSLLTGGPVNGWLSWFLSGALLGLCSLFRPMYILFCPFALLISLFEERQRKRVIVNALATTFGVFLIILPWSLCLTRKAGSFVLVSTTGGEVLAEGLNPELLRRGYQFTTTPEGRANWSGPGKFVPVISETGYLSEEELKLPGAQTDRLLRQRVLAWILKNPGAALYLEAAKLLYMWGIYPFLSGRQTLLNLFTLATAIMSILSIVRFRGYIPHLVRFWILPIYVSCVALISYGSWRYRQPGDLGMLALSALLFYAGSWKNHFGLAARR